MKTALLSRQGESVDRASSTESSKDPGPKERVASGMEFEDQGVVQSVQNGTGKCETSRR